MLHDISTAGTSLFMIVLLKASVTKFSLISLSSNLFPMAIYSPNCAKQSTNVCCFTIKVKKKKKKETCVFFCGVIKYLVYIFFSGFTAFINPIDILSNYLFLNKKTLH